MLLLQKQREMSRKLNLRIYKIKAINMVTTNRVNKIYRHTLTFAIQ